jgi:protein involved in ribonucleotide reduction
MPTPTSAPLLVYFSSVSGNTARFIEKLGLPAASRSPWRRPLEVDEPFVLVTPTYGGGQGRGGRRAPFPNR